MQSEGGVPLPIITIDLTDAEHEKLSQKVKESGFITMQAYVKNMILGTESSQNYLREAQTRAKAMPSGVIFTVKKLFTKEEWTQLTAGEKRRLGYDFFQEHKDHSLKDEGRNTSNSQLYSNIEK